MQRVICEEETISVVIPSTFVMLDSSHFNPLQELLGKVQVETVLGRKPFFNTELLLAYDEEDISGPRFRESTAAVRDRFATYVAERINLFSGDTKSKFPLDLTSVILTAEEDSRDEEIAYHISEWLAEFISANFCINLVVSREGNDLLAILVTHFEPNNEYRSFPFLLKAEDAKASLSHTKLFRYFGIDRLEINP